MEIRRPLFPFRGIGRRCFHFFEVRAGNPWTSPRAGALILLVLLVWGVAARASSLLHEPWLDEVWGWRAAAALRSPWDALSGGGLDGHTSLATALLRSDRADPWFFRYRLFSVGCGFAALALLLTLAGRLPPAVRGVSSALLLSSFPLAVYGSEARPYAPAGACVAASTLFLLRRLSPPPGRGHGASDATGFVLFSAAAFLFHPSTAAWTAGLVAAAAVTAARGDVPPGRAAAVVPAVSILVVLYFSVFRGLGGGTGPTGGYLNGVVDAISTAFGGPELPPSRPPFVAALCAGAAWAIWTLGRETVRLLRARPSAGAFFLTTLFLFPAALLFFARPRVLMPRYLLWSACAAYPVAASWLVRLAETRPRTAALFATAAVAAGAWRQGRLVAYGRGANAPLYETIVASGRLTTATDHDWRHGMMIDHWRGAAHGRPGPVVVPRGGPFDWYLTHTRDVFARPARSVVSGGETCRLEDFRPYAGLSGWAAALYRCHPDGARPAARED